MRTAAAVLDDRFEVERELDATTWLVRDRRQAGPARVLRLVESDAEAALEAELRLATTVSGPHVARLLEAGRTPDGRLFFTQEVAPGEDPFAWAPGRSEAEVVLVVAQLLRALDAFHARGLVTGGVRPLRLRVATTKDGPSLTLLDPGGLLLEGTRIDGRAPRGAWLAPERAAGARIDRRANIHEAGVLLRELLAAATAGSGSISRRALRDDEARARALALTTVAFVLTSPSPDERPATATAALELLRSSTGLDVGPPPATTPPLATPLPTPLVGREEPLGRLAAWASGLGAVARGGTRRPGTGSADAADLGREASGPPSLVVVTGPAGSGRRALVDRLATRLAAAGARVVRARCAEGVRLAGPWGPLVAQVALEPPLLEPGPDGAVSAARAQAAVVDPILAAARDTALLVVLEDLEAADPPERDVIEALARRAWVARRWAEEEAALAEPNVVVASPPRLLIVATADATALSRAARALLTRPFARELALAPLPARDLPRLAQALVGGTVSDPLQERLALGARGLPGRVERIVRDALLHGDAAPPLPRTTALEAAIAARLAGAPPAERDLARALAVIGRPASTGLLARATGLDAIAAERALGALAAEGLLAPHATVVASSAWHTGGPAGHSDAARRADDSDASGETLDTPPPGLAVLGTPTSGASRGTAVARRWALPAAGVRRALLLDLDVASRRAIAVRLAAALVEGGRAPSTPDALLERALLLATAVEPTRAEPEADPEAEATRAEAERALAAARAALAGAPAALARLERAAARVSRGEVAAQARRAQAEALAACGRIDAARRLLVRLSRRDGPARAELLVERAALDVAAGDDAGAKLALEQLALLEGPPVQREDPDRTRADADVEPARPEAPSSGGPGVPPLLRARARLVTSELLARTGTVPQARAACDAGLDALKEEGGASEQVLEVRGRLLAQLGRLALDEEDAPRAETLLRAALALLERVGRVRDAASSLHRLGLLAFARGDDAQAESHWRAELTRRVTLEDARGAAQARSSLALAAVRRGHLGEARSLLRAALRQRQEVDDRPGLAASLHNLGWVFQCAGALEEAAAAYRECLALRRELGDGWYAAAAATNLAQTLLDLGRTSEAQALLDEALATRVALGDRRGEAATLAALADADLRRGDFARARARAAQSERLREEAGDKDDLVDAARRGARIHLALGGLLEAQRGAERALGLVAGEKDRDGWPAPAPDPDGVAGARRAGGGAAALHEAACRLLLGEVLARRGAHDRGRRELERARRAAEGMGDRLAARAAAVELAAMALARGKPDDARFLLDSRPVPQPGKMRPLEGRSPPDRHGVLRVRERLLRARIELAREKGSVVTATRCAEEAFDEARRAELRDLEWRALQVLAATAELRGDHERALALTLETQELVEELATRVPRDRREGYLAADVVRSAALRGDSPVVVLGVRATVDGTTPEAEAALAGDLLRAMPDPEAPPLGIEPIIEPGDDVDALPDPAGLEDPAAPERRGPARDRTPRIVPALRPSIDAPSSSERRALTVPAAVARADFAVVVGLNRTIVDEPDVARAYEAALDAAVKLCRAERGALLAFAEGSDEVSVLVSHGLDDVDRPRERFARKCAQKAAETGELVLSGDVAVEGARRAHRVGLGLRSVLCAPVTTPDGRRVALYLDHAFQLGRFGAREVELLEVLADQCAIIVGRAALEGALHRQRGFEPGTAQRQFLRARASLEHPAAVRFGDPAACLVGRSDAWRAIVHTLEQAATTALPVLIEGPPGVGKGAVARALHARGGRGKLIVVDLCELADEHALVELFGHEANAFPGAGPSRPGLLRQADGGTLLLERLSESSPEVQAKLLRALDERSVRPVGAATPVPFDARVVTTGKAIDAAVSSGAVRADLVDLLAGTRVVLPPLADRPEDHGPLIDALLDAWGEGRPTISAQARAALEARGYPGNVRELKAVLRAAAARARNRPVEVDDLPAERTQPIQNLAVSVAEFERGLIARALQAADGDLTAAAKSLGVARRALKRKVEQHGLGGAAPDLP